MPTARLPFAPRSGTSTGPVGDYHEGSPTIGPLYR